MKYAIFCVLFVLLGSCAERGKPAPVVDIAWKEKANVNRYQVKSGDTLYSIAWRYGLDYKVLARFNHLSSPYPLSLNRLIYLPNNAQSKAIARTVQKKAMPNSSIKKSKQLVQSKKKNPHQSGWKKPTNGKIMSQFNKSKQRTGVEISGKVGQAVKASKDGIVAYSGNGLRGYGNLIIIKHDSSFLSAYAYNRKNLVKEGQKVKAGAKIAEMGVNNKGNSLLHFEIRRNGKPVNPLSFMQTN